MADKSLRKNGIFLQKEPQYRCNYSKSHASPSRRLHEEMGLPEGIEQAQRGQGNGKSRLTGNFPNLNGVDPLLSQHVGNDDHFFP